MTSTTAVANALAAMSHVLVPRPREATSRTEFGAAQDIEPYDLISIEWDDDAADRLHGPF